MDVSPAKRSYFTCANVWWKLLFHSTWIFSAAFFSRQFFLQIFLVFRIKNDDIYLYFFQ